MTYHAAYNRSLKFAAVPPDHVHPDYRPDGIAPRIGHVLGQIAQESSDAGHFAEGILRSGDHHLLPIFADKLQDDEHPHLDTVDWRHLPRAISIDKALHTEIGRHSIPLGHSYGGEPLTPSSVLSCWVHGDRTSLSRKGALAAIRAAEPDASKDDLIHSLFRLQDNHSLRNSAAHKEAGGRDWLPLAGTVPPHQREQVNGNLKLMNVRARDPHQYRDTRSVKPQKFGKGRLKLLFARLRSHLETQTLLDGVGQAQAQWRSAPPSVPYPTEHLTHAANYFRKAGDPRSDIIDYHSAFMGGHKNQDPHLQHVTNPQESRSLSSSTIPLPDGSHLFVETHGHHIYPGVHAVSVRWTPKGGKNTYSSHWHPDDARGLAEKFGEAHEAVGKAFHEALDHGEDKAEGYQPPPPEKFSRVSERDFHDHIRRDPDDTTHALAYSDWLEEQGKDQHAKLIRDHVKATGKSAEVTKQIPWGVSDGTGVRVSGSVADPNVHQPLLQIELPDDGHAPDFVRWYGPSGDHDAARKVIEGLVKEGAQAEQSATKNAKREPAVKMAAYRAPAGGMIVGNTAYPGGSLVPDLQKVEYSAGTKPNKKAKLRALFRKVKGSLGSWDSPDQESL